VLKARLKTVGVSEYAFEMEAAAGRESGTEWRIIDVGGSRSQVCWAVQSILAGRRALTYLLFAVSRSVVSYRYLTFSDLALRSRHIAD
jgi:hypothetical protein